MRDYLKFKLPEAIIVRLRSSEFKEFANSVMQIHVVCSDDVTIGQVLVIDCMFVLAVRGIKEIPFKSTDVVDVYQTTEDIAPPRVKESEYFPFFSTDFT